MCAALFLAVLLHAGYVNQRIWPNQLSRFSMLLAMVHAQTVRIDALRSINIDMAEVDGHAYSDKAPGTAFLALPSFTAVTGMLTLAGKQPLSSEGAMATLWLATWGSSGLLAALGTVAMLLQCWHFFSRRTALIAAVGLAFGTLQLPYTTQLFSHASTIGLLCIALWLTQLPKKTDVKGKEDTPLAWMYSSLVAGTLMALVQWSGAWFVAGVLLAMCGAVGLLCKACLLAMRERLHAQHACIVAGLACGMAVIGEYPAAIAVAGIVAHAAYCSRNRAGWMLLGGCCPIALLLAYNVFAFGSPWTIGYQHNNAAWMQAGMLGMSLHVNWDVLYALLISQGRGLFFWSPFLLLCLPGYWRLWQTHRALFWLCLLVPLVTLGALATMQSSYGGYAVGPRYLSPAVPFVLFAAAAGIQRFPILGSALLLPSVALNMLATLVDPLTPESIASPLFHYYIPLAAAGDLMPNLGSLFSLSGFWSLLPLLCIDILLILALIAAISRSPAAVAHAAQPKKRRRGAARQIPG